MNCVETARTKELFQKFGGFLRQFQEKILKNMKIFWKNFKKFAYLWTIFSETRDHTAEILRKFLKYSEIISLAIDFAVILIKKFQEDYRFF